MTEIEWTDAEREAVRDELSGSPIGRGYYTTQVGTDEARDMADEVLDALAPHVAARAAQAAAKALREFHRELGEGRFAPASVYVALLDEADRIERGKS